jgi:mono/diheme cytochrome c family protein
MTTQAIRIIAFAIVPFLNLMPAIQQQPTNGGGVSGTAGSPMSGAEIFKWYCAACHGKDAKGNGPAASELKMPPPDLTLLSKRNGGKFPEDYVTDVLLNGAKAPAHGRAEMPVWGPLFAELNAKGRVTVRISDVVHYVESLQSK